MARYTITPTAAPAVPGALGTNPAPPADARATASRSRKEAGTLVVVVFAISIGSMGFFRWLFPRWNAITFAGPVAEIEKFTSVAAERPVRISFVCCFFTTDRTL